MRNYQFRFLREDCGVEFWAVKKDSNDTYDLVGIDLVQLYNDGIETTGEKVIGTYDTPEWKKYENYVI